MGRLESSIENAFLRELHRRWPEAVTRKMNGYGHRDWPDRLVILPHTRAMYVEFKRPGEELRPSQSYFMGELEKLGVIIFTADNVVTAIECCEGIYEIDKERRSARR